MRFSLLLLLLLGLVAPAQAAPVRRPAVTALTITSKPSGAQVWIDGAPAGVTPLALNPVAPGAYTVVVGGSPYKLWGRKVVVRRGQRLRVHAPLKAGGVLDPTRKTTGRGVLEANADRVLEWRNLAQFAINGSGFGGGDLGIAALDTGLGYYVDVVSTGSGFAANFYLDEAETQLAGQMTLSLEGLDLSVAYSFTEGPYAGASGQLEAGLSGLSSITATGNGVLTDGSTWRANVTLSLTNGVYSFSGTLRLQHPGGATSTWSAGGTLEGGRLVVTTSSGYRIEVDVNADGSGGGTVWAPGSPDPFAVFSWNSAGEGTITYADGTTETFDLGL